MILKPVEPKKRRSRTAESIGRMLPAESALFRLSRTFHVRPPSRDRSTPTPVEPVSPSPVRAKRIDWFGSPFRGKTAIDPVFREFVGPKSVSGSQFGPWEVGVRKLVALKMPPDAPPA